jgi:pyruvate-formate lyase-activating enzyme
MQGYFFAINESAVSYDIFSQLARVARNAENLVGCSTNGYFTSSSLEELIPYIDTVAVGVKGNTDAAYRGYGGTTVEPVFRNISTLVENGVHVKTKVVYEHSSEESVVTTCIRIADIYR